MNRALCFTAYALLLAAFFAPVWSGGQLLAPSDAWLQSVPAYLAGWKLWTPYLLNGMPVAADPTTMSLYPLTLLCQWLGVPWNIFLISAYLIAAIGMHLWMELATGNRLAAATAAITFILGGFLINHVQHMSMLHAAAWIVFVLYGIELMRHGRHRHAAISIVAGVAMSILAGHPQITFYGFALSAIYALWLLTQLSQGQRLGFLLRGLLSAVCGLLLSAVLLFPAAELVAQSNRAAIDIDYFLSYSLNLRDTVQLLFPMLWGSHGGAPYGVPYFGGETHAGQGFTGALSLLLSLSALTWRESRFWLAVATISLLLAMGGSTPLGHWMYHVPGYNMFRVPSRNLFELVIAFSVLSALGVAALCSLDRIRRIRLMYSSMGIVALIYLAGFAAIRMAEPRIAEAALKWADIPDWQASLYNGAIWVPLAALIAVLILFRLWGGRAERPIPLLLAVVIGIGSYSWFENWRYDSTWTLPNPAPKALAGLKQSDERFLGNQLFSRFDPVVENNWPRVWQVKSAAAYNPLLPERYRTLLGMSAFGAVDISLYQPSNVTLDLLSVRHLFADAELSTLLDRYPQRYERVGESGGVAHYLNRRALPRFRFVDAAEQVAESRMPAVIRSGRLSGNRVFTPASMSLSVRQQGDFAGGEIKLVSDQGREVVLDAKTDGEALLVAADAWFPGWHVEVDGVEAELLQADYVNRAVIVPAGEHSVRFYYRPYSFYWGAIVSLFGLLLAGGLVWRWR